MIRLDEGDGLVSGHTLRRHQAVFLESWTDRVVVGHHTHVSRPWYVLYLISELSERPCTRSWSVDRGDGPGFSILTKWSEAGFIRVLDQIGHLRDTLCELECGSRKT